MQLKKLTAILLLACAVVLTSCTGKSQSTLQFQAMDTFMTVQTSTDTTANLVKAEIERLDGLLSATEANSDIGRLNQAKSATVDEVTADILGRSVELCRATDGAVDLTIYPIVREWGFTTEEYKIPTSQRLAELLEYVDYSAVEIDGTQILLGNGTEVDLGAFAKGYAADRCVDICSQNSDDSALLNLGGTVAAVGTKADGSLWKVGITSPKNTAETLGYIECCDSVVATSGGYERYFVGDDGTTYIHIIDSATGLTVDNGTASVTVVSNSGIKSDALSTALFVMGLDRATEFWQANRDFDFVIVADDTVFVTNGIKDSFKPSQISDYKIEYIS